MGTRQYWVDLLAKIALPVLQPLAEGRLHDVFPVDAVSQSRASTAALEAFGRTVTGIAPWLDGSGFAPEEDALRARTADLVRRGLRSATDPASPDRMDFLDGEARQPIVDAAFLAHGLLCGWETLWEPCDAQTKRFAVDALRHTRRKTPYYSNWLLFGAMIESFLYRAGEDFDEMRVDYALRMFDRHWYVGDGLYSDGEAFHQDYYNSYVIQPMMLQILDTVGDVSPDWAAMRDRVQARAVRYAAVQERLIAPDGSFPVTGRSICYRMGAFQHLADIALRGCLPVPPASVRCALTAVLHRCMDAPGTFDDQGFLTVGLCGRQPSLREEYITTGSLYLCCAAFRPLGLPPEDPFWSDPDVDWTGKAVWSGADRAADHAAD